ncbi:protein VASCULATURE COMPLEXITY AND CONNECTIVITY-like [Curcuma longa]|uniref:protein VASCULATURE COMPLEXITY AND CONNECTIVITY-like n=1 Tax=Curcuma longa TaxID=136217 RepID=UPI003D9EE42A
MARKGGVLICVLIVIMDIVAGILGIEAQVAQNKQSKHLRVFIFECKEPVHEAYRLGLAAAILLLFAHAIANLLGGCVCILSTEEFSISSANRQTAAATLLLSWIIVVVGFIMLIAGAMANAKSKSSCGLPHRHLLSIGGILCFVHGVFCVAYYSAATTVNMEAEMKMARNVAAPTTPEQVQEIQP